MFNTYEIFYDRTRKGWPFDTDDCMGRFFYDRTRVIFWYRWLYGQVFLWQDKGDLLIQVTMGRFFYDRTRVTFWYRWLWAGFSMTGQGWPFDTGDCMGRFHCSLQDNFWQFNVVNLDSTPNTLIHKLTFYLI